MRFCRARVVAALFCFPFIVQAQAADIKVMTTTAFKVVLDELGPQFEKATENKLDFIVGPSAVMKSQIDQGAAFDVAILIAAMIDDYAASGKIDPATRATVARAGLGVAIRAGAPKPDVGTAGSFKRALLGAKSIGFNNQGASRAGIEAMFAKLGIADEVKPKITLLPYSAPVGVAKGEVELGLGPVSEIVITPGTEVAGAFPPDYQSYLVITTGVAADSKSTDAARAFVKFLSGQAAAPVIKAKGMEPG